MPTQHNAPNTLENIAADLMALANDLAQGKLRVGNRLVEIGNPLFIKTKQKITGDTAYCTLSFQAPLRISDQEETAMPDRRPASKKSDARLQGRPPEGKKIKKEIASLWKSVGKKLEQGQVPTPAEEKSLLAACENYCLFSEPAWHGEWLRCTTILREALACAHRGDLPTALAHAEEVNRLTKDCHKKHK
ncbi:MAG: hypothetical protein KKE83_11325 [Proteobacteria bacterium]|nr:hypothetical protein [Pseudomonadota bacterium]MBU1547107.1 hypothetical protein [Pseudomonadota bacterium]MBU2620261.1 hypothetical protein [Pseudomonadota bacterium]